MPNGTDTAYSNEAPSGPTLEQLAGTGQAPPGDGNAPATGVASAPGGGAIDAAVVGTDTEILGAGSDGGGDDGTDMQELDVDAVTGTGAGAGTGEPNILEGGTAQSDDDTGDDGFGGRTLDDAARNATMPPARTQPDPTDL